MISLTFLLGVMGLLFIMAFASRRRFGLLGLALAAGSLLATNWSGTLTPFIQRQGVSLIAPPLQVVVEAALIILPSLILLFSGPSYNKMWQRVLGGIGFALLGYAFLAPAFNNILTLDQPGLGFYSFMSSYVNLIIVVGLIAAVVDMFLAGSPKRSKKHEH